jgi:hypothetical protein
LPSQMLYQSYASDFRLCFRLAQEAHEKIHYG